MKKTLIYREQIADKMLLRRLAGVGAVLVEGPKCDSREIVNTVQKLCALCVFCGKIVK